MESVFVLAVVLYLLYKYSKEKLFSGGAADLIVVEQPDGTLKTHPWFISLRKFYPQEVKRSLRIDVNGAGLTDDPLFELPALGSSTLCDRIWSTGMYEVRSILPTPQQLDLMRFKSNSNTIKFTLESTGRIQHVESRVFRYKWDQQFVIVDIDGTITESDIMGHMVFCFGGDWTHPGVVRLLSAIKHNGYEILYLSARSISMAILTRQLLLGVEQNGERLPEGPVILCPDGFVSSFHREVIERTPHIFKISVLQSLKVLFPMTSNPFFAGFGNRETDKYSYKKTDILEGKIFIINVKGKINGTAEDYDALLRRVDVIFPLANLPAQANIPAQVNNPAQPSIVAKIARCVWKCAKTKFPRV